jgi:hypothetical protein
MINHLNILNNYSKLTVKTVMKAICEDGPSCLSPQHYPPPTKVCIFFCPEYEDQSVEDTLLYIHPQIHTQIKPGGHNFRQLRGNNL